MIDQDAKEIRADFDQVVNMTPRELRRWLETENSRSVGQNGSGTKSGSGGGESTGHQSGRRIVSILEKKVDDLSETDYQHMRTVIGYLARHSKQRPKHPVDSRWRYSLMNGGTTH